MRYLSVCSGIGTETVAWHPLGWECAAFAEIEGQASAVLQHHWPGVPNVGDFTKIKGREHGTIDLIAGGTPCQSFSVAGRRGGLDDERGALALEFCRLAERSGARWVIWENVAGVLSLDEGRAFGSIVGALGKFGYDCAWRILDSQYVRTQSHPYAVPQRRRRVFVVGYLGDWRPPVAVLFEPEGLRRDSPPRRETGPPVAGTIAARVGAGGGLGTDFEVGGGLVAGTVTRKWAKGTSGHSRHSEYHNLVVGDVAPAVTSNQYGDHASREGLLVGHTLRSEGHDASEDGPGRGPPLVPFDTTQITHPENRSNPQPGEPCPTMSGRGHPPALAFSGKDCGADVGEVSPTLRGMAHDKSHPNGGGQVAIAIRQGHEGSNGLGIGDHVAPSVEPGTAHAIAVEARQNDPCSARDHALPHGCGYPPQAVLDHLMVRRITPLEAERLQGLPDHYTAVPWRGRTMKDGPRYRLIGNGWSVNVARWIGERIALFEAVCR